MMELMGPELSLDASSFALLYSLVSFINVD